MALQQSIKQSGDRIDRRGFLNCMAWAGSGVVWTLAGGVARGQMMHPGAHEAAGGLSFAQISDSHIGFGREPNMNVVGTLEETVRKINALPNPPAFIVHTGDITHLSKPAEFDTAANVLKAAKTDRIIYLPGEHDVLTDNGKSFLERYGKDTKGAGWFSFDQGGMHFVGLVNVLDLKAGGLGSLGREQLEWLEKDLKPLPSDRAVVVFAHVPLWTVYEEWGWGTDDGMQALSYLRRFGSVSVLNGHIHQTMQKVEGNMVFHTAASTAFPQPAPGSAPSPGPWKVPAAELRRHLGLTAVRYRTNTAPLAIVDEKLEGEMTESSHAIQIDNFSFTPVIASVQAGQSVTWTNHDDIPHNIVASDKSFASSVLDTDQAFTHRFDKPGEHSYFCSLHPKMTGKILVRSAAALLLMFLVGLATPLRAANSYAVRNLVSDVPGTAETTDSNLVNPWGLASSATSPFWVANNRAGNTTVYDSAGKPFPAANPLVVGIPPATGAGPRSAPTGEVFNDTTGFELEPGKPAAFLFASEDGSISGWSGAVAGGAAITVVDNSTARAVYKGLAVAETASGPRLYVANFSAGTIDVFDSRFAPVAAPGSFSGQGIPAGFAPFNIQRFGRRLYVAYAMQDEDKEDDVPGAGNGFLVTYDLDGNLQNYLVSNGPLNSPWGMAIAPETFGDFGHALLVGNFGDGRINAFDACSGEFLGSLHDPDGNDVVINGLWGLRVGNGRSGGDATALYFTAGSAGTGEIEDHGVFGSVQPAPPAPRPAAPAQAATGNATARGVN